MNTPHFSTDSGVSTLWNKTKLAIASIALVLNSCGDTSNNTKPDVKGVEVVEQTYTVKAEDMVKTVEGGNEATVEEVAVEEVKTEEVKTPSLDDINFDEGFEDDVAVAKKDADQAKKDADQAKKDADATRAKVDVSKKDADQAKKDADAVEWAFKKKDK